VSHERFYSRVNGPTIHQFNRVRWLDEVTPRHLAGGGDPRHVTEYLLAAGWSDHSAPSYPHVLLESPDQQLHLTLEPTAPEQRDTWWRIHPADSRGAQVAQATDTLAQVKGYLRSNPPIADVLPLLAPLLDEDTGVPILLGDVLRSAARLVSQQATRPVTDETGQIIDGLREAVQEATAWHVLHWDVQRLGYQFSDTTDASTRR
jgi:hypothetical protein